ncbi:thioredoxin [Thermoplasmatales archaeon SW_10_69_26]|jgi:thioredoxin 1|nr:MAG: thioredoxin [Thermoplasmatales archaeon SW_10_69_26]
MGADGSPTQLTDDEFDGFVNGNDVALIDFWAPWCGPCKQMEPILDELAEERDDIAIGKINTDDNPQTPQKFGVMSIPTLLLMVDGEVVDQMVGALPKEDIVERLDKNT